LHNTPIELRGADGQALAATVSAARLGCEAKHAPVVAILRVGEDAHNASLGETLGTLTSVLDTAPDAALIIDPSRFITYANPAIEQLTGYRPDEIVDRPLALYLREAETFERVAEALRPDATVRDVDLEIRHRDGRTLTVSVSAGAIQAPGDSNAGTVAYLRDVTDRRRSQADLSLKNDELEHYVHSIAHDLRSPLVSMLGFTRLLRDDYAHQLDEKGAHFLDRVEQAGRTMESLIRDVLELSRIGSATDPADRVSARSVLLQLQAELKPQLDEAGVGLVLPVDPPTLDFDQTRLYQLLSNLVGNALDHMGDVPDPRIEVDVTAAEGGHLISVADNGHGIPPEHQERIFEIFQSLGPARNGRRGTGIGLAIVRKIAEARGGRAWVESQPGLGACFKVLIPS
ncbi:MAG: PAS domain-containing sensor histidine kinase, partial [Myxococcales bacterium]|nr:PAS domain-containing sensor histidine kinase [Myxococcales bacterium]